MSYRDWQEILTEIIDDVDFSALTDEQWSEISEAIDQDLSAAEEAESTRHVGEFVHRSEVTRQEERVRDVERGKDAEIRYLEREKRELRWTIERLQSQLSSSGGAG